MSYRDRRSSRRRGHFDDGEDINPMNYVSNLSDVMLILAVGIMLALILHWNVPVGNSEQEAEENGQNTITFTDNDLDEQTELPDDLSQVGNVYYDSKTGKYYIVQDEENGGN